MISTPELPALSGYVEVEMNGARKYRNAKTGELLGNEKPEQPVSERIAELENALCDMDAANEEAHSTYETALCDIDEALNGGTV